MRPIVDFLCGILISGFCTGFFGFVLMSVYERLRSDGTARATEDAKLRTAFTKTLSLAVAIGMLGFIAIIFRRYFHW